MKRTTTVIAFIGLCLVNLTSFGLWAQEEAGPVINLRQLHRDNPEFKTTTEKMLKHVAPLADGSVNPWKGRDMEDLYTFLNEWFYFLPNTQNGLDRILEFSFLYYKNPHGMKFITEEPGRSWSLDFVEERGKYMDSPASAKGITPWLQDPHLKNEDFVLPVGGFKSFNEFFYQRSETRFKTHFWYSG